MIAVAGVALVKELYVLDSVWPDYVLDTGYQLKSLSEVENFIKENHHLPSVPSAAQIRHSGIPVGKTEAALTQELEEQMLYIEQLSKKNQELSDRLDTLERVVENLKKEK